MARFLLLISLFFAFLAPGPNQPVQTIQIPQTGTAGNTSTQTKNSASLPSLTTFIPAIKNGNAKQLVGVFIDRTFAFRIVQQPASNAGFVSSEPEVVTQFSLASQYGSIGLLAHNTAAGEYFADITNGQKIILVYGDGHLKYYQVTQIRKFQALSPTSPYSNFSDLAAPDRVLSVENLFYQIYQSDGDLVFQTCIEKNGESSWGRLFIIAHPIEFSAPARHFRFSRLAQFNTLPLAIE